MALSLLQTKGRIKSVSSTKKITKAMELVATSKLKKAKDINAAVTPFKEEVNDIISYCYLNVDDKDSSFFKYGNSEKKLYIIVSSTLGLCGGYNINLEKYAASIIDKQHDDLIIIGNKAQYYFNQLNYHILLKYDLPALTAKENLSRVISNEVMKIASEYHSVYMISSKFVNSLNFNPTTTMLLPLSNLNEKTKSSKELLIEPSPEEVLEQLVNFYIQTDIKALLLESMLCEQSSRRNAMETATDNASELLDKLMLDYNKSRQAAITQEITEISAAKK